MAKRKYPRRALGYMAEDLFREASEINNSSYAEDLSVDNSPYFINSKNSDEIRAYDTFYNLLHSSLRFVDPGLYKSRLEEASCNFLLFSNGNTSTCLQIANSEKYLLLKNLVKKVGNCFKKKNAVEHGFDTKNCNKK